MTLAVGKQGPRKHRFKSLRLKEFSLVTDPAIMTQTESSAGAGVTVVKFADGGQSVPEYVTKAIVPKEGEDYRDAIDRLVDTCRVQLMQRRNDEDLFWYVALKIYEDRVLLGDLWEDPFSGDFQAYQCSFTQDESGEFQVTNVTEMRLKFVEVGAAEEDAAKNNEGEPQMKVFKGVELGGQILELPVVPGSEFKIEDTPVVKFDSEGNPEIAEGYALSEDGVVRKQSTSDSTTKNAQDGGEGSSNVSNNAGLLKTLQQLQASGVSFKATFGADGTLTLESGAVSEEVQDTSKNLEEQLKRQQEEIAALKQRIAGTSGSDPENGAAADTYTDKGGSTPRHSDVTHPVAGVFTKALHGRVPAHLIPGANAR